MTDIGFFASNAMNTTLEAYFSVTAFRDAHNEGLESFEISVNIVDGSILEINSSLPSITVEIFSSKLIAC